jgi:hypothetical protein
MDGCCCKKKKDLSVSTREHHMLYDAESLVFSKIEWITFFFEKEGVTKEGKIAN